MNLRLTSTLLALGLVIAGCSSSGDSAGETETTKTETTETETTEAADTATDDTEAATDDTATDDTEPAEETEAPAEGAVAVGLKEWALETETTVAAGSVTFELTNNGSFPHELAVAKGGSYETLPLLENGAVDEATLGADFLGRSDRVEPGATGTVTFDLEAGTYVFLCNIAVGPNSHAKAGQTLTVTVE